MFTKRIKILNKTTLNKNNLMKNNTKELYYNIKANNNSIHLLLKYNDIDYFNEEDTYLFYDDSKLFVSKVVKYNASLYTKESLNYKVTTLKSMKLC